MRILTCEEVLEVENAALGRPDVTPLVLMQRAGYAVAQFCISHFKFATICAVCGKGKNGGYGLAAATALLRSGANLTVIMLVGGMEELGPDAAALWSPTSIETLWSSSETDFEADAIQDALGSDLIIDAIVGADCNPLTDLEKKAVELINDAPGTIVSVDVPSGVDADSTTPLDARNQDMVFAHGIVTFIAPRPAHVFGELTSGPIAVSEIGIQPAFVTNKTGLTVTSGQEVEIAFAPRRHGAPKGRFGHVLVIAGSRGKAGAAGLAGMAALRAGAGSVTVACPESIQATVAGFSPALMTEGLPETNEGTVSIAASDKADSLFCGIDAVVLGPGLSRNRETAAFIRGLVAGSGLPLVLDADGLNAFEGHYQELTRTSRFLVMIQNSVELARLVGIAIGDVETKRRELAQRISKETGSCVVLKGWRTIVAGASGETWVNMSGNPALSKAGSGDVLCGIIAAALARNAVNVPKQESEKSSARDSAGTNRTDRPLLRDSELASTFLMDVNVAAAVYLHGLAGDIAWDTLHDNTVLATDLLDTLTESFRECELQMDQGLFYLHK